MRTCFSISLKGAPLRYHCPLRDTDKWIRRKLRCYIWKQWDRAGYRELHKRGATVREAWNTHKSAHGPWLLSKTPVLALTLTVKYFSSIALPALEASPYPD